MSNFSTRQLFKREWQVKYQSKSQWLYPLILFIITLTLFPLAMGTDAKTLAQLGVPAVWIACLLSLNIGMDGIFRPAFDNGTLAQLIVARVSLTLWVLIRLFIHWLFSAGILALLIWCTIPLFSLSWQVAGLLSLTVIIATPMLLMTSALASALTLCVHHSSMLIPLIALPLQLPVLIFAIGSVDLYTTSINPLPTLALLFAGSILSVLILPWLIAYVLKMVWLS